MRINYINDVIIPGAVGGMELGLKTLDDKRKETNPSAFEFEPIAPYVIAGAGTAARIMDIASRHDESIKMAVAASLPRVITGLYDWVKKEPGSSAGRRVSQNRSVAARRISTTVPEMQGLRIV